MLSYFVPYQSRKNRSGKLESIKEGVNVLQKLRRPQVLGNSMDSASSFVLALFQYKEKRGEQPNLLDGVFPIRVSQSVILWMVCDCILFFSIFCI
jgi:hypothetical protein